MLTPVFAVPNTDLKFTEIVVDTKGTPMPNVIAVDPSLTGTGICVVHKGKFFVALLGDKGKRGLERLTYLAGQFARLVAALPGYDLIIEGYAMGARDSHSHSLGEVGGAYKMAAFSSRRRVITPSPNTIKKFATGKGNAPKEIVMKELFKRWGIDVDSNNLADAVAIALFFGYGWHIQQGLAVSLPALNTEAITTAIKDKTLEGQGMTVLARPRLAS